MKRNDEPQIKPNRSRPAYGSSPRRAHMACSGAVSASAADAGFPGVGAEGDGHGPLIVQADRHLSTEAAAASRNAAFSQPVSEPLTQPASPVRVGGTDEAGPAPTSAVRIERELRYDQRLATDVLEADVESAGMVREDPQLGDFVGKPLGFLHIVGWAGTDQDRQSSADLLTPGLAAVGFPAHRRAADPLNDHSHESWILHRRCSAWGRGG